jgi:hypothetical protein
MVFLFLYALISLDIEKLKRWEMMVDIFQCNFFLVCLKKPRNTLFENGGVESSWSAGLPLTWPASILTLYSSWRDSDERCGARPPSRSQHSAPVSGSRPIDADAATTLSASPAWPTRAVAVDDSVPCRPRDAAVVDWTGVDDGWFPCRSPCLTLLAHEIPCSSGSWQCSVAW